MMKIIAWVGTIASIAGSFLIAFGMMLAGYSFFLIGSLAWLFVGFANRDYPILTLNFTFFIANIIGFIRAIM